MLKKLVMKNRSYRRFYQRSKISRKILYEITDLARLSPSAGNLQPLRFKLINSEKNNENVFSCLSWAGYLEDWEGPKEEEKPSAYIIILSDKDYNKYSTYDAGIACQSILLGASEKGLGGCIVASIQKDKLRKILRISAEYEILLVIALGRPKEKVVIEELKKNSSIKYWRDNKMIHHVPKRKLSDIIF